MVSDRIKEHLSRLLSQENFGSQVDLDVLVENWEEKESWYNGQMAALKMEEIESLAGNEARAVLGLSFSGSLLALYVPTKKGRKMEYASIKLRDDVPNLIQDDPVIVDGDFKQGQALKFSKGKLEQSSPLYRIVAAPADLSESEQNRRLSEAMIFLTNGFLKMNKKSFAAGDRELDHFTKRNMVSYMAKKHNISQSAMGDILDDFFTLAETGALLGENVAIGKIGRLKLKERPPQKARVVRNPQDGSDMTLPAKPAQWVPKMRFSSYFKDRVSSIPLEEQ